MKEDRNKSNIALEPNPRKRAEMLRSNEDHYGRNSHLLVYFAQVLFLTVLKRGIVKVSEHQQMLSPWLPLLSQTLSSNKDELVFKSMQIFSILLRAELSLPQDIAENVVKKAFETLTKANLHTKKASGCLKLLLAILEHLPSIQLTNEHLILLLRFIQADLDTHAEHGVTFGLLKSVVNKKYLIPELYDVIDVIFHQLMTSSHPKTRIQCTSLFLQFLHNYPLTNSKRNQYLDKIVANLSFKLDSGRETALEILAKLFHKFPAALVNQMSQYFFVPLVLRLVNEESKTVRPLVGEALKQLFSILDQSQLSRIIEVSLAWLDSKPEERTEASNEKQGKSLHLQSASCQVFALLCESQNKTLHNHLDKLLPLLLKLISHVSLRDDLLAFAPEEGQERTAADLEYKTLHQALVCLEKLSLTYPKAIISHNKLIEENLWPNVPSLLQFSHVWVRAASSRVVGSLFALFSMEEGKEGSLFVESSSIFDLDTLSPLLKAFQSQIEMNNLEESFANQALKNIVFICVLLESKRDKLGEEACEKVFVVLFNWFASLCRGSGSPVVKRCAYKWIAAMTAKMGKERLTKHLPSICYGLQKSFSLSTIQREEYILENEVQVEGVKSKKKRKKMEDNTTDSQSLHELATQVRELVKNAVGSSAFVNAYSEAQQKQDAKVVKSKQNKKVRRVTNFGAFHKEKKQRRERQKLKKKLKNAAEKEKRKYG